MKKLLWLIVPVFGLIFASCANETDVANPNTATDIITTGKWKVNQYMNASQDQTSDFAGYSLSFSRNGTVVATYGGATYNGTWAEDATSRKLILNFTNATPVLERINNQWSVADIQAAMVNLSNDVPNTEFLAITQQ